MLFPLLSVAANEEEGYKLINIEPADSSVLVGFYKGDSIIFTTNTDSIFGGFNVEIWDANSNSIVYSDFTVNKTKEGQWMLFFYENLYFLKGHTYQVELTGHEGSSSKSAAIAKFIVTYQGNGTNIGEEDDTDYEYSNIKYERFSPVDGSPFDNEIRNDVTVYFSGDAIIDANRCFILDEDSIVHKFETISRSNINNAWELIISKDFLASCTSHFSVNIYAKDKGGRMIKGNKGKGLNSHYELTYLCDYGYPKVAVTPRGGNLRKLSKLVFGNKDGISILNENNNITLFEEDKTTELITINSSNLEENDSLAIFTYSFPDTLKTEGTYYLHIPENTFALGHKLLPNRDNWVKYQIVDRLGMYGVTIDPDDGSLLPSLTRINITFNNWDAVGPYYQNRDTITVTDEKGDTIAFASADYDRERTQKNQCFIKMKTPVTKTGHYYVNVPAKAFILGSDARNMSEAMYFEFDVEEPPLVVPEFAVNTMLDDDYALRHILVQFPEYVYVFYKERETVAVLTNTKGEEVAKGIMMLGRYWNELCITLDDEYHINTANDFVLILPANSITMDGKEYKADLEIPVHYDPATSLPFTFADTSNSIVKVYNLQGMLIREGKASEVLNGLKGLYIVNGKKMIIKPSK